MYSDENVQNKWKKLNKQSVRTEIDYIYELVKYGIHVFTPPKFMRLNESKLQYDRKIFQVVSPSYLKYKILFNSLKSDYSLFEDQFDRKSSFRKYL